MRLREPVIATSLSLGLVLAACGGNGSPAPAGAAASATTTTADATSLPPGAVDPNAPEVVEPGDIPDNQAFVPFTSADGRFSVKVPEGWTRTDSAAATAFTDKYNSIAIAESAAASAPTVDSVKASALSDVSGDPAFKLIGVKPVTRHGGDGVVALFEMSSAPNEVTGKKALLAVERYVFAHNGTELTLTLSGAKGADNVDPWKIVSDSLTWH